MKIRIPVDFNTMAMDDKERVLINLDVQKNLAEHLHSGLVVVLYDEEMEVKAVVEFDAEHKIWFGQPDWSTRRDLPYP